MKLAALLSTAAVITLASTAALADVAPDPCDGKVLGDACVEPDGTAGTCQPIPDCMGTGCLTCTPPAATGTGGGGSGGSGGAGTGGQDGADGEDDGGCGLAAGAPREAPLVGIPLFAAALIAAMRRRGRARRP